jgi:hypothetical protein
MKEENDICEKKGCGKEFDYEDTVMNCGDYWNGEQFLCPECSKPKKEMIK